VERLVRGQQECFQELWQLSKQSLRVMADDVGLLKGHMKGLEEAFAYFKETQSMDSYFLKKMKNETEAKEKRKEIIKNMEEFLGQQPLTQVLLDSQEDMEIAKEKSKSSGVHLQLNQIMNDMRQFKGGIAHHISNEFIHGVDEGEMLKMRILDEVENEYSDHLKGVQMETAKKILKRYQKKTKESAI